MSLMAYYVDGELQTSTTSSDSLSKTENKNAVNSDTFLTLLVAEMQNQDPLEPTSNTEWVSQYATFTQVEQMGEMSDSMDMLRANNLVGKEVIMQVTSVSTGETSYVRGPVDYITIEEGKPLLNIGGSSYSLDDLDTVASDEYFECYDFYTEFTGMMDALPDVNQLDKSYKTAMGELYDMYSEMTDSQKDYMQKYAPAYLTNYETYIKKMEELGITYGGDKKEPATLDSILEAFNTKMDALMTQLSGLSSSVTTISTNTASAASGTGSSSAGGTTDATQGTDKTADGTEGTDNADSTAGATGSTDSGESTDSTDSAGSTDGGESTDSAGNTESTDNAAEETGNATGETETTTEAGNDDSEVSDDTLDKLTEDI